MLTNSFFKLKERGRHHLNIDDWRRCCLSREKPTEIEMIGRGPQLGNIRKMENPEDVTQLVIYLSSTFQII